VNEHALPTAGRTSVVAVLMGRAMLPVVIAAAIYALLLAVSGRLLNDPDTYWHLAVGRWIVDHRTLPVADPFSFTAAGEPWIAFEWLSDLAYAGAFAAAGWSGVVVLAAAASALAFGLLAWFLARDLAPMPVLVLVTAAVVLTAPHLLARPHVLVLPVMVAWVGSLVRAADHSAAPPFRLLPLLVLWANLHASVGVGVAFVGPVALEAILKAERSQRRRVFAAWAVFAAFAVVAASLTPYGPQILLMPIHTLGLGDALLPILEWQPQNFSRLGAFEIVLLASAGYALQRGVTLPPVRILVLLGLVHLALAQSRHADLLALFAPLLLSKPLADRLVPADDQRGEDAPTSPWLLPGVAGGLVCTLIGGGLLVTRHVAPSAHNTPAAAIAATDLASAGRVFNEYGFGGYLIHAGIAPFIDGRTEVYGRTLMLRHSRAVTLLDLPDLLRLLDEYRIDVTLLAPHTPAIAALDRLPNWDRVYTDDIAVVHKRRGAVSDAGRFDMSMPPPSTAGDPRMRSAVEGPGSSRPQTR
jgi:hypothetical protein